MDEIWKVINAVLTLISSIGFIVLLVVIFGSSGKRVKKIKYGKFEADMGNDEIDPNTPCPYRESYTEKLQIMNKMNFKIEKFIKEAAVKIDNLTENTVKYSKLLREVSIDQYKIVFYNRDLPNAERLIAGLKYIHEGLNADMKKDITEFIDGHRDIYDGIIRGRPDLKIT